MILASKNFAFFCCEIELHGKNCDLKTSKKNLLKKNYLSHLKAVEMQMQSHGKFRFSWSNKMTRVVFAILLD